MTNSSFPSQLAYFQEVTQGTGPADGAAWVTACASIATGARLRHIGESLDMGGVEQQTVPDERSHLDVFDREYDAKGLKNVTFPMSLYATGSGATTAAGSQIAATALSTLLTHCLGGTHRSNSTLLSGGGHTTTVLNVTATTNITPGCLIVVQDTSTGEIHPARVLAVAALAVTLDEALPFTPVDGDTVRGCITNYIDTSVLVDSSVGPTTYSWLVQKGLTPTENFEFHGCKSELKSLTLSRNALPVFAFETQAAHFDPPGTAPSPTWAATTIHGNAPVTIGPASVWTYQTQGTTTRNAIHVSESTVDVGVPAIPVDTNTEVEENMEGRQGYSTGPAPTTISLNVVPLASSAWTQFDSASYKRLRFYKRASNGQIIIVCFPKCQIKAPKRGTSGPVSSNQLMLEAFPGDDAVSPSNTALATSKILIGFA